MNLLNQRSILHSCRSIRFHDASLFELMQENILGFLQLKISFGPCHNLRIYISVIVGGEIEIDHQQSNIKTSWH